MLNAHFLELNIVEPAEADIVEDQQDLPTLSSEEMMKLGLIAQVNAGRGRGGLNRSVRNAPRKSLIAASYPGLVISNAKVDTK